jgi:hypothetical protein
VEQKGNKNDLLFTHRNHVALIQPILERTLTGQQKKCYNVTYILECGGQAALSC